MPKTAVLPNFKAPQLGLAGKMTNSLTDEA